MNAFIHKAAELRSNYHRLNRNTECRIVAAALLVEVIKRELGITPHENQLLAAMALIDGFIIEMPTGEGKSLTALFPACVFGLLGKGCHVITANDYLAERDASHAKQLFRFLGITVGAVINTHSPAFRAMNYQQNVVFSTEKEIGFDWLRQLEDRERQISLSGQQSPIRQTPVKYKPAMNIKFHSLIIDEVDSILIDRAFTPLILAQEQQIKENELKLAHWCQQLYGEMNVNHDYIVMPELKRVLLTPQGKERIIYASSRHFKSQRLNWSVIFDFMEHCITANRYYIADHDYTFKNESLEIIDVHTGRIIPGRKWQHGLHLAIEIKERRSRIMRTERTSQISINQLIGMYQHVSGMTGTVQGCEKEISTCYKVPIVYFPPRIPPIRKCLPHKIFTTKSLKHLFIALELKDYVDSNQAVLIGTTSVEDSQALSNVLHERNIQHKVLNALHDTHEAEIISQAGRPGQITIATNMAGRGTDIKIEEIVKRNGGLHLILSGLHPSSRIDRQMIGRCARQGDPGSYCYRLSLEDDIIKQLSLSKQQKFMELNLKANRYGILPDNLVFHFTEAQREIESLSKDRFLDYHKQKVKMSHVMKRLNLPENLVSV